MDTSPQSARIAVVRGIPHPPHKHRWCGLERWVDDPKRRPQQEMEELPQGGLRPVFKDGKPVYAKHALPWPADEVKVEVVDNPAPFDPDANGGRPVQISPTTLSMLMADHRIAVRMLDGAGGDPAEALEAKAKVASLEEKLASADRRIASLQEQVSAAHEAAAAKVAGEIAKLRQELAETKAKLAEKKR